MTRHSAPLGTSAAWKVARAHIRPVSTAAHARFGDPYATADSGSARGWRAPEGLGQQGGVLLGGDRVTGQDAAAERVWLESRCVGGQALDWHAAQARQRGGRVGAAQRGLLVLEAEGARLLQPRVPERSEDPRR
jgi:hypothetical protein